MSSIQIHTPPRRAGTLWHAAVGLGRPCSLGFKPKEEIAKVVLRKEEDKFRAERTLLQVRGISSELEPKDHKVPVEGWSPSEDGYPGSMRVHLLALRLLRLLTHGRHASKYLFISTQA